MKKNQKIRFDKFAKNILSKIEMAQTKGGTTLNDNASDELRR